MTLANHMRTKHPNDSASEDAAEGAAEGAAENTPPDSPALLSAIAVSSLPPPLTPNNQPESTTTRVTHVSLEDFVNYKNNITNTINAFTTAAFEEFSALKRQILDITSENAACMLQLKELTAASTANDSVPSKPLNEWHVANGTKKKNVRWQLDEVPLQNRFSSLQSEEITEVTTNPQRAPRTSACTTPPTPVVAAAPAPQRPSAVPAQQCTAAAPAQPLPITARTLYRPSTTPTQEHASIAPAQEGGASMAPAQERANAAPAQQRSTVAAAQQRPSTAHAQQRPSTTPPQERASAASARERTSTAPAQQRPGITQPNNEPHRTPSTPSVLIIGDSMIKNVTSYQIRGSIRDRNRNWRPKINVKPFLGAQTRTMPRYCEALLHEIDKPDIVIVHVGTNDIRAGTSIADMKEDFTNLHNYLREQGMVMIVSLLTCRSDDCKDSIGPVNHMLIELCDELGIGYSGNENINSDHLNQSGYHLHKGGSDTLASNLSHTIYQFC